MHNPEDSKTENSVVSPIVLSEIKGEPRARDIDIAKRLGFAKGGERQIRRLIVRHRRELEAFGELACHADTSISGKGREVEVEEFWLNEEQALLVSSVSSAAHAPAVRSMLIRVFVAWRRGHLGDTRVEVDYGRIGRQVAAITDDKISVALARIPLLINSAVEAAIAADPRRAVEEYVSVRQLLDEAKCLARGRNSLNRKFGHDLKHRSLMAAQNGKPSPARKCPHSGVWLYQRDFATTFMRDRGTNLVSDHNAKVRGQNVFHLVPPKDEASRAF